MGLSPVLNTRAKCTSSPTLANSSPCAPAPCGEPPPSRAPHTHGAPNVRWAPPTARLPVAASGCPSRRWRKLNSWRLAAANWPPLPLPVALAGLPHPAPPRSPATVVVLSCEYFREVWSGPPCRPGQTAAPRRHPPTPLCRLVNATRPRGCRPCSRWCSRARGSKRGTWSMPPQTCTR